MIQDSGSRTQDPGLRILDLGQMTQVQGPMTQDPITKIPALSYMNLL